MLSAHRVPGGSINADPAQHRNLLLAWENASFLMGRLQAAAAAASRLGLQGHAHMHTSNNPAFASKNNTHTERLHPHATPRRQRHTDRCMVGQTRGHCRPHTVAQHTGSGREGKTAGCSGNQRRDGFSLEEGGAWRCGFTQPDRPPWLGGVLSWGR